MNDFEGWPPLREGDKRDLVYFAVKKEHDMNFQYDNTARAFTYEEVINQAILEDTNQFDYHGHTFLIEKNEDGNYDVISNGQKVSEALLDGEECIVEIQQDKRDYIRNTKSDYYDILYQDIFRKVRTKEYGISNSRRANEELVI